MRWRSVVLGGLVALSGGLSFGQTGDRPDFGDEAKIRQYLTGFAERVVLPAKCSECHKSEFQVWQTTRHATQFQDLHTTERAKKIYKALKLELIRRATDERTPGCLVCHYTPQATPEGLRAQISVGCESCHGPARDWIGVHNNFGVKEPDFQKAVKLETPEHKVQRVAESKAKGMRRPSEIYDVAANCFQCHTVPYEELVNRGGHSSGSDFELVSWSQKIRHNFLRSFLTADGKTNAETSPERKRLMYVTGRALALEYSVRGIAAATSDDTYLASMVDRNGYAVDALMDITARAQVPEIQQMLDALKGVALKANNRAALVSAADRIGASTKQFLARADPSKLSSLDELSNPKTTSTKTAAATPVLDKAAPAAPVPAAAKPEAAPKPGGAALPATGSPSATPPSPSTPSAPAPRPVPEPAKSAAAPAAVAAAPAGEAPRRPSWRPDPSHEFLPVPCGKCHDPQTRWWRGDRHSKAVDPFRDVGSKQRQIAAAYGISASDVNAGNQICMACHGTVVGNPAAKVRAGVGCQQCHGPGADYKEPHQKNRQQAIGLGMIDLKNSSVRAETCAGCHYITEPRLVAAGHPSGDDFKIDARILKIKHWGKDFEGEAVDIPGPQLVSAYAAVVAKRGPVPRVARAAAPAPAAAAGSGGGTASGSGVGAAPSANPEPARSASPSVPAGITPPAASVQSPNQPPAGDRTPAAAGGTPPSARPTPNAAAGRGAVGADQPPPPAQSPATSPSSNPSAAGHSQPAINSSDPVEEVLLQLKARLEQLYELARKGRSR